VINKNVPFTENETFQINDEPSRNPNQIAEAFNSYFVNIGPKLAESVSPSLVDPTSKISRNQNSIFMEPTDELEVTALVKLLKDGSAGCDDIAPKVIRSSIHAFSKPLTHILNLSISTGVVPKEMKTARVTPIFKSGDKELLSNYRPVSVLPCFSKILEKIVKKRLTAFIDNHQMLHPHQFGFRAGHSTSHALITLVNELTSALDKGNSCLGVFLDLSKAFDTVDHDILLQKLEKYGIRGIPLQWMRSYLNERSQCVKVLNVQSSFQQIVCGVPQGSVLGPLLFLLYVNDISDVCKDLCYVLFADDTNLFMSGKNLDVLYRSMNLSLDKVVLWLNSNKLSLNVKKTHYVLFTTKKRKDIPVNSLKLNGVEIERVEKTKFLGVVIDERLNWSFHINYIKKKISKNIGIIYKARNYFNDSTLLTLYYTFIFPYLCYCIEVWGSASIVQINSLLKLQKRVCRLMTHSNPREHALPLFKNLSILTVQDIHSFSIAVFVFKFCHDLLPSVFTNLFSTNSEFNSFITRYCDDFSVPLCHTAIAQKAMKFKGVISWNNLPYSIKCQQSFHSFKKKLKSHLLGQY